MTTSEVPTASDGRRKQIAAAIVSVVAVAAIFVFLFVVAPYSHGYLGERMSSLRMAYNFWTGYEDFGHGMLIPFIVAAIVWIKRKSLARIPIRGSWWGLPILAAGFGVYWIGYAIDHHYPGWISAQILVAGCIVWLLGWPMMKALVFPWAFLSFAWPFLFLNNYVAFPLRLLMAELAYQMLNFLGLACVKVGSAVVSAANPQLGIAEGSAFRVDIADPCSGIRSLFALMMVSALYGYFAMPKWWQKTCVFLASVPLAIAGNFARILMLTFGILIFGAEFAVGTIDKPSVFHMLSGFVVFFVAILGMVAVGVMLRLRPGDARRGLQRTMQRWRGGREPHEEPDRRRVAESAQPADIY